MNTAKEDDVRTHSRIAVGFNMDFCDQMLDQQVLYQVVNQVGRGFDLCGSTLHWYEGTGLAPGYSSN